MKINFETTPSQYRHWSLEVDQEVARLTLKTDEDGGLKDGYKLKLNSYDLAVDIELADAIERIRFEHPQVSVVTLAGGLEKIFCAGANIFMLKQSDHTFKVNFCKFTNETRLNMEDASQFSGIHFLCAANGITAGGGYELALACDKILLVDDGNSAVSLPEVPLLGVLPGTGGLTRLIDKRHVRKDLADAFCTVAEGVKGKKALDWNLVDALAPQGDFNAAAKQMEDALKGGRNGSGKVALEHLKPKCSEDEVVYRFVKLTLQPQTRSAELTIQAPTSEQPTEPEKMCAAGDSLWCLRAFRELNDAIMHLRFNFPQVALVKVKTVGDPQKILDFEASLIDAMGATNPHWFVIELVSLMRRVLKKIDVTSKSFVALIDEKSCFAGSLAELLFLADQSFMTLESKKTRIFLNELNREHLPMGNARSRLQQRFSGNDAKYHDILEISKTGCFDTQACKDLGLVTHVLDEMDYEDEVRIFCEERASLSPDALTGMEASLRFGGSETMESKIFSRLSAWQNWIFTRQNATGENGALTNYGKPTRPSFDFTRC